MRDLTANETAIIESLRPLYKAYDTFRESCDGLEEQILGNLAQILAQREVELRSSIAAEIEARCSHRSIAHPTGACGRCAASAAIARTPSLHAGSSQSETTEGEHDCSNCCVNCKCCALSTGSHESGDGS